MPTGGRVSRPRAGAQPAPAPEDTIELSGEAVALNEGGAVARAPATYGPRGALTNDGAGRQASVDGATTVSKRMTELMVEIEAVQQNSLELIGRYRQSA